MTAFAVACGSSTPTSSEGDGSAGDASRSSLDGGADADATDADGAASCPLPGRLGSAICERCLSERCCDVIVACDHDPACKIVLTCVQACLLAPNEGPCIDKCVRDTPAGATKYRAFESCIAGDEPTGCSIDCSQ